MKNFSWLTYAGGFSFPSLHAVFSFTLVPFVTQIFKTRPVRIIFFLLLFLLAFSRIYLAVHFVEDVVVGALIGLAVSYAILGFEKKHRFTDFIFKHFSAGLEFRRQIAHLVTGISIVFLLKMKVLNAFLLILILIVGGLLSFISRKYKIPFIYEVLQFFERPEEIKRFPGKGSFFLVLGCLLCILAYSENIAYAAITIMAVGDSMASVYGIYLGIHKNPFNPKKHIDATIFAILLTTLGAFTFVDFHQALMGASGAMLIEAMIREKINRIIDDNLIVPVMAGLIISLVA